MNVEDIIYLSLLVVSMGFGFYYRTIKEPEKKKLIGAGLGFIIVLIVSGYHVLHVLISTTIGACIILFTDQRKCHIYTFFFSFLYLFFFRSTIYFGIPYPPSHTNLVQMMLTLKIIGLAFEVNQSLDFKKKKDEIDKTESEKLENGYVIQPTFGDIFCYIFNYCGVLTGPYCRYRIFLDHLYLPYHNYDKLKEPLLKRIYWLPFLGAIHLISSHYWPLSYVYTEEFLNRSFLYRYWYIWPQFVIFRSRIYFGLILTEIVCMLGGLGVYPTFSKPRAGHGPTVNFKELEKITEPDDLKKLEYNYEAVHCISPYEADTVPTMREGMKYWNITIQYWMASYIYKQFPYKKYRTQVTMLVSALWHGMYSGYYFCIATVPFALMYEDIWVKILLTENNKGLKLKASKLLLLFLKMQMFSYQGIAFLLLEIRKIMHYYNCVSHCMLILYTGLYFIGKRILKNRKRSEQKLTKVE